MKIEMTVSHYATATGFKLVGAGVHDVPTERGKYLLATFPAWFQTVDRDEDSEPESVDTVPAEQAEDSTQEPTASDANAPADTDAEPEPETDSEAETTPQAADGAADAQRADAEPEAQGDEAVEPENEEPEAAQNEADAAQPTKSLSKMNKDELVALAGELEVEVNGDKTNEDLRAAIKAKQEANAV